MKKNKITVSGDLGSGKSTVSKLLEQKLGWTRFSMGDAWRMLAEEKGMTILELNQYSETHPLDEEMDRMMVSFAAKEDKIILDSRLAWHFISDAFKVHLVVDPCIAATRIMNDTRGKTEGYTDINEAVEQLRLRKSSENDRYLSKYGVNCADLANYDLIVDTSTTTPDEITDHIITKFNGWIRETSPRA